MLKKICTFILLSIVVFISCKNSKKETFQVSEDIYDSIRKITIHGIPEDLLEDKSDSIKSYYATFQNHEIWIEKENREDLIAQIERAHKEGLNPDDYNLKKLFFLEIRRDSLELEEQLSYDILLTQSFEKLANHYYKGKLNPREVYNNWDLPIKKTKIKEQFKTAIQTKKIASTLKSLLPKHQMYLNNKKALAEINLIKNNKNFDSIKIEKSILPNNKNIALIEIKKRLHFWKDLVTIDTVFNSIYDKSTLIAVKKFQERHGLENDGVIGQGTIKMLNYDLNTRKKQIIANLERWRWFPENFGEQYILVNLPEYKLKFIQKDTLIEHKVVVGRPERKTPILSSKLSNLVFNPTWTIPPTILKEDLKVEAAVNKNYFYKNRITIYKSKTETIPPQQWKKEDAEKYKYVQKSGYNNSLGLVKFNFPNKHSVYLHDTNHRDYFVFKYRALSSGCVRVENPLKLAKDVLCIQDSVHWYDGKEINKIIKSKKEAYTINVKKNIYVHQLYWTSWHNETTGINFREDIYNIDLILYEKLRN